MDTFCPRCGAKMEKEVDVAIVFCPSCQVAFSYEFMAELIKMAVDLRDTANAAFQPFIVPEPETA